MHLPRIVFATSIQPIGNMCFYFRRLSSKCLPTSKWVSFTFHVITLFVCLLVLPRVSECWVRNRVERLVPSFAKRNIITVDSLPNLHRCGWCHFFPNTVFHLFFFSTSHLALHHTTPHGRNRCSLSHSGIRLYGRTVNIYTHNVCFAFEADRSIFPLRIISNICVAIPSVCFHFVSHSMNMSIQGVN